MRYFFFKSIKTLRDRLLKPAFSGCKLFTDRQLRKKKALKMRLLSSLRYAMGVLKLFTLKQQHYRDAAGYLSNRVNSNTKKLALWVWRKRLSSEING